MRAHSPCWRRGRWHVPDALRACARHRYRAAEQRRDSLAGRAFVANAGYPACGPDERIPGADARQN